jgi:hypothetical protein
MNCKMHIAKGGLSGGLLEQFFCTGGIKKLGSLDSLGIVYSSRVMLKTQHARGRVTPTISHLR